MSGGGLHGVQAGHISSAVRFATVLLSRAVVRSCQKVGFLPELSAKVATVPVPASASKLDVGIQRLLFMNSKEDKIRPDGVDL